MLIKGSEFNILQIFDSDSVQLFVIYVKFPGVKKTACM